MSDLFIVELEVRHYLNKIDTIADPTDLRNYVAFVIGRLAFQGDEVSEDYRMRNIEALQTLSIEHVTEQIEELKLRHFRQGGTSEVSRPAMCLQLDIDLRGHGKEHT
jgi:hypothetical protein